MYTKVVEAARAFGDAAGLKALAAVSLPEDCKVLIRARPPPQILEQDRLMAAK